MGTERWNPSIDLKGFLANSFVYSCISVFMCLIEIVLKASANIVSKNAWINMN